MRSFADPGDGRPRRGRSEEGKVLAGGLVLGVQLQGCLERGLSFVVHAEHGVGQPEIHADRGEPRRQGGCAAQLLQRPLELARETQDKPELVPGLCHILAARDSCLQARASFPFCKAIWPLANSSFASSSGLRFCGVSHQTMTARVTAPTTIAADPAHQSFPRCKTMSETFIPAERRRPTGRPRQTKTDR